MPLEDKACADGPGDSGHRTRRRVEAGGRSATLNDVGDVLDMNGWAPRELNKFFMTAFVRVKEEGLGGMRFGQRVFGRQRWPGTHPERSRIQWRPRASFGCHVVSNASEPTNLHVQTFTCGHGPFEIDAIECWRPTTRVRAARPSV